MDAHAAVRSAAQGKPNASLIDFAAIVGQLAGIPAQERERRQRPIARTRCSSAAQTALSNVNGVNMDDEMSFMLQVERTYSASSKLISTVDEMLKQLLAAVR